jgi:hypothetical protein
VGCTILEKKRIENSAEPKKKIRRKQEERRKEKGMTPAASHVPRTARHVQEWIIASLLTGTVHAALSQARRERANDCEGDGMKKKKKKGRGSDATHSLKPPIY